MSEPYETGTRVQLDDRYDYPTSGGVITGWWTSHGEILYTICRDMDGNEASYPVDMFTVDRDDV